MKLQGIINGLTIIRPVKFQVFFFFFYSKLVYDNKMSLELPKLYIRQKILSFIFTPQPPRDNFVKCKETSGEFTV